MPATRRSSAGSPLRQCRAPLSTSRPCSLSTHWHAPATRLASATELPQPASRPCSLTGRRVRARKLRRVVHGDVHVTLSALESRFLELLRDEGLPLPITNRPAGGRRVDCRWPEHRLTVELDGYRFHNSRHSWEQDRRREREARARGDEFRRYSYDDVTADPTLMLAELRPLLLPLEHPG